MTLSDGLRRSAMDTALKRMLEDLDDRMFIGAHFEIRSERFSDLPETTWLDLRTEMLVELKGAIGCPMALLMGRGWIAALKKSGIYDNEEQRQREISLKSALRDVVTGR